MKKLFVPTLASLAPKEHTNIFRGHTSRHKESEDTQKGGTFVIFFRNQGFYKTGMKQNKTWDQDYPKGGEKRKRSGV